MGEINFLGIIIGLSSFFIIGLFHPLVIKGEYYFGVKIWWAFALAGCVLTVIALFCRDLFWSAILSVGAFSCFWSVKEIFDQRKRVEKGWFPKNPKRLHRYKNPDKS